MYFKYLIENKYGYIFNEGNKYQWGLGQMDDNASTFPPELDAATAVSSHLCTPSLEQAKELKNNCKWADHTYYFYEDGNANNYITFQYVIVTGPNSNKIGLCRGKYMINYHGDTWYDAYNFFEVLGSRVDISSNTFNQQYLVRPVYK